MRRKVLILDGPSASGKTTLVNSICEAYPSVQRIKVGKKGPGEATINWILGFMDGLASVGPPMIIDRFHISDLILRSEERRLPVPDIEKYRQVTQQLYDEFDVDYWFTALPDQYRFDRMKLRNKEDNTDGTLTYMWPPYYIMAGVKGYKMVRLFDGADVRKFTDLAISFYEGKVRVK